MKITIEQYDHTITYEVPYNDLNMEQMLEILENLLKCTGYSFTGNLEIVDDSMEDEEKNFRIVDEPDPKIRFGDASIATHYRDGTIEYDTIKNQINNEGN